MYPPKRHQQTRRAQDAANASPASVAAAITVGASGTMDAKESYSNFGSVVDIYAPGGK